MVKNDIISRQAAIDAIYETFCYAYCDNCEKEMNEDLCGDCHRKYQNWSASKKIISKTINSLPPAERIGKWIDPEDPTCYKCSVCGEYATQEYGLTEPIFWRYCPNCGANMYLEE